MAENEIHQSLQLVLARRAMKAIPSPNAERKLATHPKRLAKKRSKVLELLSLMGRVAVPEGFEPSIRLFNRITV